jgi:hypothetical protein
VVVVVSGGDVVVVASDPGWVVVEAAVVAAVVAVVVSAVSSPEHAPTTKMEARISPKNLTFRDPDRVRFLILSFLLLGLSKLCLPALLSPIASP